ncbi:MAG: hypothetical protein IJZ35_04440 [Clostridia bacterium]|nr:hypothetical protein [Clostridia bacterium]
MSKKIISALLVLTMLLLSVPVASAAEDAAVYNIYGDGMLFKQNEDAVIAGTATKGSKISAVLYNDKNEAVASGESIADDDGTFAVSFSAPAGGYDVYSIVLKVNGAEFERIENVVFGELWLASGQSNMQYPLSQAKIGVDMYENNEKLSEWLRVLLVPAVTEYKGSTELVPCEPQKDIPGAQWVTGEDNAVYNVSAVAYFFAASLMAELDMPVGIINSSLGGSVISSWISREAIDGDEKVKNILVSAGEYYDASDWNESERSIFYDMTSNYNLKIEPLRHFSLSGMIWYQGESDVIFGKTPEQYASMFDLMQRSYTELFEYENGLLPVICTQLVSYPYNEDNGIDLVDMNIGFAQMQKNNPESRAVVSVYDVPLSFIDIAGSIHPDSKKEIGERMTDSAMGLVYGSGDTYTTATVKSAEIKDGRIYVSFDNAGDGLVCNGEVLRGFAIAGADGVYVQADAEIVNENTVVIYNEKITSPVSASYAYSLGNMRSNLYASKNGELCLPVSPFVTENIASASYWYEKQWADCDDKSIWHIKGDDYTVEYSSWECENAQLAFSADSSFSGENGLHITETRDSFSVSPVLGVRNGIMNIKFFDEGYDYSNYGTITFNVRNNGDEDVIFDTARIYANAVSWYSTVGGKTVVPADGEWYEIEVDLNNLNLYGIDIGMSLSNELLKNITDVEFVFSGENADISFDNVRFIPENEEVEYDFSLNILNLANVFRIIPMFVKSLLEYVFG